MLLGLTTRLRQARLYLRTSLRAGTGDFDEFLASVITGGVDIIEVSQPGVDPQLALDHLRRARAAAAARQKLIAVDDDPELAGRFRADVLRLADPAGSAQARTRLSPWALIGATVSEPVAAEAALADPEIAYLSVGPVFPGPGRSGTPAIGLDLIGQLTRTAPVGSAEAKPWFAAGGIDEHNLDQVLDAGARRIEVSAAIGDSPDPEAAARRLRQRLDERWRTDPQLRRSGPRLFGKRN